MSETANDETTIESAPTTEAAAATAPAAEAVNEGPTGPTSFVWGVGRRKSAVARVRIITGTGKITINDRNYNDFLPNERDRKSIFGPLEATNIAGKIDIFARCTGGGTTGQAGAIVMGLARSILKFDPTAEPALRTGGFLTRDSRMKERKKYGQRGARRRFQFSKR